MRQVALNAAVAGGDHFVSDPLSFSLSDRAGLEGKARQPAVAGRRRLAMPLAVFSSWSWATLKGIDEKVVGRDRRGDGDG